MGRLGIGFLRGRTKPPSGAFTIICGTSQKRRNKEPNAGTSPKREKMSLSGSRPIITMRLHHNGKTHTVRTLLDTGCSINLMNQQTVERLGITKKKHDRPIQVENYTGETVRGAGQYYTEALRLQHRKHYTTESFEISPMEADIDLFLPFGWIARHPPQGAWTTEEVRFNNPDCLSKCTK